MNKRAPNKMYTICQIFIYGVPELLGTVKKKKKISQQKLTVVKTNRVTGVRNIKTSKHR